VLPGKQYSADDIVRIVTRRWWMIAIPLVIGTGIAAGVSKYLPNKYQSETLIMLLPQRVPDSYVKATVTDKLEDRLATLQSQILSRSRLERIILDLNLYQDRRRKLPMEDVVQRMRDEIAIKTEGKESLSFRLTYVSNDAKVAQQTTERLASLFIEESMRDRENQAEDTNQFLDSQLQDAKRRLVEQEKKLEEYRQRYSGQLPSQAATNLQAIQNLQLQVQSLSEATDRARERRLLLERQIADLQVPEPVVLATPSASPESAEAVAANTTTAQQLETAKAQLKAVQLRLKPDHPDVKILERRVAQLTAKLETEAKAPASAANGPGEKILTPAESARARRLRDLRAELEALDRELADKQQQDKRLRGDMAAYQGKLDAVPSRETDLVELTRDYATLQTSYESLLRKREDSKLAANLERRNIGEQFKVLDPARVPERPFSPNRMLIAAGGSGGGLALGILLIGLLEYRDSSFKTEAEVERVCQLPVLALVPIMTSAEERRRARRKRVITVSLAAVCGFVSVAAVVIWRLGLL